MNNNEDDGIIRHDREETDRGNEFSKELVQRKRSMIADALAAASKVKDKPRKKG